MYSLSYSLTGKTTATPSVIMLFYSSRGNIVKMQARNNIPKYFSRQKSAGRKHLTILGKGPSSTMWAYVISNSSNEDL